MVYVIFKAFTPYNLLTTTRKEDCFMEYLLLAKVGMVINVIVKGGYCVAGLYLAKTGARYVKDYKESVAKEKASS